MGESRKDSWMQIGDLWTKVGWMPDGDGWLESRMDGLLFLCLDGWKVGWIVGWLDAGWSTTAVAGCFPAPPRPVIDQTKLSCLLLHPHCTIIIIAVGWITTEQ